MRGNLTSDPTYSHRAVWRIAAPLIVSNLSVPLLGMVDTAVVGHLDGPQHLGAVAIGATVFSFLYMGLNFLRMGTTGIVAQAFGDEDFTALRTALAQALAIALALGAGLLLLQGPIGWLAWRLIDPGAQVLSHAQLYYDIRIWSAPATLTNFVLVGWFIGMHNARAPLVLLLVINGINIVLDLLFVVGWGMKADGVALASVIAEYSGLATGIALAFRELQGRPGQWLRSQWWDRVRLRRLFGVNTNLFIRTMSLMFAFGFLTAQGARQGTLILAANALLLNFQTFMAYGLDGLAHAAEALVGRAVGTRSRAGLREAVRVSMIWSAATAVVFTLLYAAGGWLLIDLLTDLEAVRETARAFLPWMIVSPLISVWSFVYDGVYVGATLARQMRNTMLVSTFLVYLPAWYVLQPLGNHGLWLAFLLFMAARGLTMHWMFRRLQPTIAKPV